MAGGLIETPRLIDQGVFSGAAPREKTAQTRKTARIINIPQRILIPVGQTVILIQLITYPQIVGRSKQRPYHSESTDRY
jgi:hypothetical protein